jgi:hypothetical protein
MAKLNLDLMEKMAQELKTRADRQPQQQRSFGGGGGGRREFKWYNWDRNGVHHVRLLEPTMSDGRLALMVYKHHDLYGQDPVMCVSETFPRLGIDCEVCKSLNNLYSFGLDVGQMRSRGRGYTNCVDRLDMDAGTQIIGLPYSCHQWLVTESTRRDPMDPTKYLFGDICDPISGRDVMIDKKIVSDRPKYTTNFYPNSTRLHAEDDHIAKLVEDRFDIERIFKIPDEATLGKIKVVARTLIERAKDRMRSQAPPQANVPVEVTSTTSPAAEAARAVSPPAPTVAPTEARPRPTQVLPQGVPKCYAKDWRPGSLRPAKCRPCFSEIACSNEVKKLIEQAKREGKEEYALLPTEQTPME